MIPKMFSKIANFYVNGACGNPPIRENNLKTNKQAQSERNKDFLNKYFELISEFEKLNDPTGNYALSVLTGHIVFKKKGSNKKKIYMISIDALQKMPFFYASEGKRKEHKEEIYTMQIKDGQFIGKYKEYVVQKDFKMYRPYSSSENDEPRYQTVQAFSLYGLDYSGLRHGISIHKEVNLRSLFKKNLLSVEESVSLFEELLVRLKDSKCNYVDISPENLGLTEKNKLVLSDRSDVDSLLPKGKSISHLNDREIKESLQKVISTPILSSVYDLTPERSSVYAERSRLCVLKNKAEALLEKKDLPRKRAKQLIKDYERQLDCERVASVIFTLMEYFTEEQFQNYEKTLPATP